GVFGRRRTAVAVARPHLRHRRGRADLAARHRAALRHQLFAETVMRAWLIAVIAAFLLAVVGVPLALAWSILYTESGLNLAVRNLPRRFGATEVEIRGVHGSLAHVLHLQQLLIRTRRTHLTFDQVDLNLDLAPTLLQTLHARELKIDRLRIEVLK